MEKEGRQLTPEQDALEHIVACRDKPFLEERFIDSFKGRGVFTQKAIEPSTFVVEYRGNIFCQEDTSPKKTRGDALNNYLFEFSWDGADWCVDASTEDRTLGRLVNDDHISPNCEMKKVVCEGKPHLCLFAVKEIPPGEEITYNYGDSSYPWRSMESKDGSSTSPADFYAPSSTPKNERDSEAAVSSYHSGSDDDELQESHENDSFATTNSHLDFRDNSPTDFNSSQRTFMLQHDDDDASGTQQQDEAAFSSEGISSDGDYKPSKAKRKAKRQSYPNRSYCFLCGANVVKIARHLFTKHADEDPEIIKAAKLPKASKERKRIIANLRNLGNYKHISDVFKSNSGELRLRRRVIAEVDSAKTHMHCPYCKAMLNCQEMCRHVARCTLRPKSNSTTDGKTKVLSEIALVESRFAKKLPHGVWKMLVAMKPDQITFEVQKDFLLMQLAQHLADKYRNNPKRHGYIGRKLQEMGRLLIALHEKSIFSFEEAIKPQNFHKVVEAVKDVAGFSEMKQSYNNPTLALKLGHSLKKICAIVLAGVKGNEMAKDTKTFMKLCAKEWSKLVSHTALASLKGRRVNKPSTIPFTHDVQVFYKYLETTAASATESLKVQESPQAYSALSRVTLAQLSVINKCAPEVSKMMLKTFQERDDTTRVLSKHFIRMNIQSRTSQDSAVLLTSGLVSAMTLLVSKREACGVHKDNPFLFAKPNSSSTSLYHTGNCISGFLKLCPAKNPEHLRSVHLHKHIARVFQFLNLENDELCHLAKLLGHDIRADRDYYRQPEAAVELAKIAKLLLAMEKGSLERFKGNSLEEIEIEDELEPDVEQGNPENDAEEDDEESDLTLDAGEQQAVMERQRRQLTPEQDAVEHIRARRDKPFLEEKFIDALKGRGVFTRESIQPSAFVVEYRGNIGPHKETEGRKPGDTLNKYLFDFSWNGTSWRVDASKEDGSLGRLVNDDRISPNCEMKKVVCEGKPHLCLFAVKEIPPGEEITYNYGDSSDPWCSAESSGELKTSETNLNAAASSPEDESGEDLAGAFSSDESCSDDEYVPEEEPSSDESYNNQQSWDFTNSPDPDSSKQQSPEQQHVDDSCIEQEKKAEYSSDDFTSDEEPEDPSSTKKSKNYCFICGKAQTKISRHLFAHRKENAEIAEVFALPLFSTERKKLLHNLRNRGNYKYNQKVLKRTHGELRLRKREPNMLTEDKIIKFAQCLYCEGVYSHKDMCQHLKNCSSKKSSNSPTRRKSNVLKFLAAAESTDQEVSSDVTKLLKELKKDEISSAVFNDSHIMQLANCWCHMNEGKNGKQEHITQRLRLMGRLLLTLRKKSINSFEDALKSENFSKLVDAVNELAEFNGGTKSGPSKNLTAKLGYSLKKMGLINLARALKEEADEQTVHDADTFMKLCEKEWQSDDPSNPRINAPTVPFIHDVQLLYQCMEKTAASEFESLTMYESPPAYSALLRVTVAQLSVLNKNMGEVSKVTLKSFNERNESELHEDAAASHSQFEQNLSKHFVRINVKSNTGKKVAVTLTPKMLSAIILLVSKRESCGVHHENLFLFARPAATITSFYHGESCIGTYVAQCGVKNAENLTALCFRKHMARVFHILSLANEDLDQLGKLLGRDIRTDAEYYQTPEAAVDIAKISELLSAMENGSLERFEGKSLEEIEIADELEPDVEQETPENSDAEEDNEGSESSLQIRGVSSSKGSLSTAKQPSTFPRYISTGKPVRGRGRPRKRRQESENVESGLNDEKKDETGKDGSSRPGVSSSKGSLSTAKQPSRFPRYISTGKPVRGRGRPRKKRQESENVEPALNDENKDEIKKDGSLSTAKQPSRSSRYISIGKPVRGRGRPRKRRQESENEEPGLSDEKKDETGKEGSSRPGASSSKGSLSMAKQPSRSSRYISTGRPVRGRGRPRKKRQESENEEPGLNDENKDETEKDGSLSTAKQPSRFPRYISTGRPVRGRGRPRKRRQESENEEPGLNDENKDETEKDGSLSTAKQPSRFPRYISTGRPVRGRGRPRKRRRKSENDEAALNDEVNPEKDDGSEERPESCERDTDEDSVRNEESDGGSDTNGSPAAPLVPDIQNVTKQTNSSSKSKKTDSSLNKRTTDISNTEKKNRLSAALAGMKEVKILIPKLDIEKLQAPIRFSLSSSVWNSVHQPVHDDKRQNPKSHRSTESNSRPSHAKMTCSHCKKSMMMGQTAYQKKGFTDVFCSKNCLLEMFPVNKPGTKTCHYCYRAITQPLDLIMAVVDIKGTMKDFCSVSCLASFRSNGVSTQTPPQSTCSMYTKSCTSTCELTLCESVHKFCSVCDNCSNTCHKKSLKLKLEEETKNICSDKCLKEFKEKTKMSQQCTTCHVSRPISEMVHDKTDENTVELFCTRTCVISYRLWPAIAHKLQAEKNKKKKGAKSNQTLNTEEGETTSGSTVNEQDDASPAADSNTPKLITAKLSVVCCHCGKTVLRGQTLYQLRSSPPEFFCSAPCLSKKHPHIKIVTNKCYNCLQVIMRPDDIILAPVGDSGAMKELCSNTCLLSVNSLRDTAAPKSPPPAGPWFQCRMCNKNGICKLSVSLDGVAHRLCSDPCFIKYHKINNLHVSTCDVCGAVCSAVCLNSCLTLTMEDGSKTICSEECLVKFKEKIETPQLCPVCQTLHQMSDMVEDKNNEGKLDFFCSSRCLMVHKAQPLTVSGKNGPTVEDKHIKDVKEVEPLLMSLDCIKQEPIDEDFTPDLISIVSTENIKDDPNAAKDTKIDSVFSLKSTAPTVTPMDLPASCSNCKRVLPDGETVYQRKGHADIFCSTPCLVKFYQTKKAKRSCHFCLQTITQPQDVLQARVGAEDKDFCSQTCLSSFNYLRYMSSKIPIKTLRPQSQCSMCSRYCISKHEIILQEVVHKICSGPCFLRFCNMNNISICENCRSICNTFVTLKMDDGSKKLCGVECLAQFKQKINTPQPCAMCSTPHLMTDMVENKNSEDVVELCCTYSCVMASKIQAVSAAAIPLNCDNCGKTAVPTCHLAMSDASIRNFCTLTCAMAFKEKSQTQNAATIPTAASDRTQCDYLKPPEKLPCAQCRRILKTTPRVVQNKGKMNFVCSLACSQEFKKVNSIMGKCEYCKNEGIIRDVKKVDGRDCNFCSEGCKRLFRAELKKEWGEYCHSCAYCLCISKTLVMSKYKGSDMKFCSEDCSSNYKMLFCYVAKCDACGQEGKLRQSLPLLGEVKYFCDLKCVLNFCNKKFQMVDTVSSPPRPAGSVASSPVIAGAFASQLITSVGSAQTVSASDIQTKVVGHASVQTAPKELRNKSMLCTPLVHNKGVSCTTQTVNKDAQTDNFVPKVVVLPLPLPVYVPLPLNLYSQFTPQPVGLPLPLPVPVFLPVTPDSFDPTGKSSKERVQSYVLEGELSSKSEMKKIQDDRNKREDGQKDRVVTKDRQRREVHIHKEHTNNFSGELEKNHHSTFIRKNSFSDSSFSSLSRPHTHNKTPPVSEVRMPSEPQPELPPPPPPPRPPALEIREDVQALSPSQQTVGKGHNKNKGRKLQQFSKADKEETSQRGFSRHHRLRSQSGIDAWKRWIQWRELQNSLDLVSSRAVTFNEDVLLCSAIELNDGLCCFITEVKRPDGEPYAPDHLFYLCLSIQQYLFENGRLENIFSDLIYRKFSAQFNRILRGFKPSITAGGYVHSRVEEEFLWDCKQLGAYSPIVLLNTLLFFCCKYFGFTTVEQHHQLSFAHVRRCTRTNQDYTQTTFLRFYPPIAMNAADTDGVPAKKRKKDESDEENILEMMENTENPLRCPVRLYEFYLSKCSPLVRQCTNLFYLQPDCSCVPSSPLWFSSTPLDDSTVEAMLLRALTVRELQGGDTGGVDQQTSDDEDDSE